MKIPLSDRLLACCGFVAPNDRVADIGCDHGYLGIHLLKSGIARSVISADVNEGPLQSAMRNALKFGVRNKMTFYLSDGVRNIPREFDVMVCAGMGADTIIHILEDAPWLRGGDYRMILQCQSKTPMLRKYLSDNGWHITEEAILREGKFLYTVMSVCWDPLAPRLTLGQCHLNPVLNGSSEDLTEYRQRIIEGLRLAALHQNDGEKKQALEELEHKKEETP